MSASVHDASAAAASPVVAAGATPPTRRAEGRSRGNGWLRLASPIALVLIWQLASSTGILPSSKLVSPVAVAQEAWTLITSNNPSYGTLQYSLAVSAERWAIGFFIGTAIAVILAVITGLSRIADVIIDPIVQVLRAVPLLGILPLFIVWFGIGELPKIFLIALGCLFPVYLNTYGAIRGVDSKLVEAGQTFGLDRLGVITNVVVPGALPGFLVGLRFALVNSWLGVIIAEQINAQSGLGYLILEAQTVNRTDIMFVALVIFAALGILADAMVRQLEKTLLVWRRGFTGS